MFSKLDVRRKSIVTLVLSQDNRKIVVRYFVNRAPYELPVQVFVYTLRLITPDRRCIHSSRYLDQYAREMSDRLAYLSRLYRRGVARDSLPICCITALEIVPALQTIRPKVNVAA